MSVLWEVKNEEVNKGSRDSDNGWWVKTSHIEAGWLVGWVESIVVKIFNHRCMVCFV